MIAGPFSSLEAGGFLACVDVNVYFYLYSGPTILLHPPLRV